eukprot:TRINITY_DN99727_c0_g1_i1.p1 TRINITY_DN99727_c0_g1~~TRINITY_DN99727_c0_g1_i1.p1  ORF type:complete len:439 (-),score=68.46 TRINITY_DN99727_c0_g1_i1:51-1367(-)
MAADLTELSENSSVAGLQRCDGQLPRASFYYVGIVSLMGWNLVLTFTHSFDCEMLGGRTFGGSGWAFWCSLCYSISLNLVQIMMSSRTLMSKLSFGVRWNASLLGMGVALVGLVLCKVFTRPASVEEGFAMALLFVALLGFSAGLLQSAAFSMAGSISPVLAGAIMTGQGVAGLITSLAGVVLGSSQLGLVLSFAFAVLMILCGVPIYRMALCSNEHVRQKLEEARRVSFSSSQGQLQAGLADAATLSPPPASPTSPLCRSRSSAEILVESAWPQALTVCAVFAVTFVVFPGVISRWTPGDRVPLLISAFQVMDVLGRSAPQLKAMQVSHGRVVSLLAMLRVCFIPVFILVERQAAQGWTQSSLLQYILMVTFAFSNGYVSTLSMMLGPLQRGLSQDERETTGAMMSFFLVFGIFFGSLLALPTQIGMPSVASCEGMF